MIESKLEEGFLANIKKGFSKRVHSLTHYEGEGLPVPGIPLTQRVAQDLGSATALFFGAPFSLPFKAYDYLTHYSKNYSKK